MLVQEVKIGFQMPTLELEHSSFRMIYILKQCHTSKSYLRLQMLEKSLTKKTLQGSDIS